MPLLIGDDYPEAGRSPDREEPASAGDLRRRPGPEGKKRDWSRWRGNRRRSMLIQDPPDPAGDDRDGADDGYGADDRYGPHHGYETGPPDSRDGFFPDSEPPTLSYRDVGYAEPGYQDSGYAEAGNAGSAYPDSRYCKGDRFRASLAAADDPWDDGFWASPALEDNPWDDGEAGGLDLEDEPSGRRAPRFETLFLRREARYRDAEGPRESAGRARRLGGILLAGALVVGVVLYVPSILTAGRRSFTGVVSGGIASLDFGTSGRVGRVRIHLGQKVRKGEVLATEAGAASAAAVRADRAAIAADQANLAALQADGSAPASITAAQAQLEKDRARRAADRMKLEATEIVAPTNGTVVAIYAQPGEIVSRTGLSSSAARAQASPGRQPRFSILPSGSLASLHATGLAPPVIALRTGGGWQVSVLIPQTDRSAVKVGEDVTISVPAARLSRVMGTIRELSPTPVSSSGGAAYEAVVRVLGRTRSTPLSGVTANVQLGSLCAEEPCSPPGPADGRAVTDARSQ